MCAYAIVSVLQRRLGVPNLTLPNGKPGVLAGLLRRPVLALSNRVYYTYSTAEVIPSQWANTSKSRLPVICSGQSAPVSSGREFRRHPDTGNGYFDHQIKVFPPSARLHGGGDDDDGGGNDSDDVTWLVTAISAVSSFSPGVLPDARLIVSQWHL